jgi:hypothetical protein
LKNEKARALLVFPHRKKVRIRSVYPDKDKMTEKREFLIYKPIDAFVWI